MGDEDIADDDVVGFMLRWNLNEDAQARLMRLPQAARDKVVQEFTAPEGMPEVNGRLIKFANTIEKQSGSGVARQVSRQDEIGDFITHWNLNDDAQSKLQKLSPHVLEIVMGSFDPKAPQEQVNGKFIMFASSVEKAQGQQGHPASHAEQDPVEAFIRHWNLNEDAQSKLGTLSPHVLDIVMSSFNPKAPQEQVNGKFIMFAASVVKAQGQQGHPAAHAEQDPVEAFIRHWNLNEDAQTKLSTLSPHVLDIVMSSFNPKAPQEQVNGKFIMFAASVVKAQGQQGHPVAHAEQDPVEAFIRHWNLNEDAQTKLSTLSHHVLEIVMSSFDPPPHLGEVNGKFIMFASSVEKAQGHQAQAQPQFPMSHQNTQVAKGFGIVGQKGVGKSLSKDGWASWSQNEGPSWVPGVGQKRSWSQSQIPGWSPPGKQQATILNPHHVDPGYWSPPGKQQVATHNPHHVDPGYDFELPAAIDEYAQIGFVHQWSLNDDAANKLKSLSPQVRLKVLNEFKPAGQPQQEKGWSGKLISFAAQLEKYSR